MRWGEKTRQHMVVSLFQHLQRCSQGPRELSISSWERCRIRIRQKGTLPGFLNWQEVQKNQGRKRWKPDPEVCPSPAHIPWLFLEGLWHVSEPFVTNETAEIPYRLQWNGTECDSTFSSLVFLFYRCVHCPRAILVCSLQPAKNGILYPWDPQCTFVMCLFSLLGMTVSLGPISVVIFSW